MLSKEQLQAIRERCEAATPGEWKVSVDYVYKIDGDREILIADCPNVHDAAFVAHAREDIPALLAEVERLEEENQRLRGALEKIENLARHHTDNPDWLRKEIVVRVRQALKGGEE